MSQEETKDKSHRMDSASIWPRSASLNGKILVAQCSRSKLTTIKVHSHHHTGWEKYENISVTTRKKYGDIHSHQYYSVYCWVVVVHKHDYTSERKKIKLSNKPNKGIFDNMSKVQMNTDRLRLQAQDLHRFASDPLHMYSGFQVRNFMGFLSV